MSSFAIAASVRFYQNTETKALWQNFWKDAPLTLPGVDQYIAKSFNTSAILLNRTADEGGITLTMPALADDMAFLLTAIEKEYLADVQLFEQQLVDKIPANFEEMTLIGRFIGEVQSMQMNLSTLSLEIGSAMDAVNGEIPGRRITTSLVGRLPSL